MWSFQEIGELPIGPLVAESVFTALQGERMKTAVGPIALALTLLSFSSLARADEKRDLNAIQQEVNSAASITLIEFNRSTSFSESEIVCIQKDGIDWDKVFPDDWRIEEYPKREVFFENTMAQSNCVFSPKWNSATGRFISNIQLRLSDNSVVGAEISIHSEAASSVSKFIPANLLAEESRELCKAKAMARMQRLIDEKGFCQ